MIPDSFTPKKVVKDFAVNAQLDRNRLFLPGFMVDAVNCRYKTNGVRGVTENVPGTLLKDVVLPAGTNKCIGAFPNTKNNTIIYLIWNSNNDDRIIEYNIDSGVATNLLAGDLGFESANLVAQGGIIDDQLLWSDANKRPRQINITLAKQGLYTAPYNEYELSLATRPPDEPPTFTIGIDAALTVNNIVGGTFQFAYRFVYKDNRESTFSPISAIAWAGLYGKPDTVNNFFNVRVFFPAELTGVVKRIDVVYKEGNAGNYFIFADVKNPVNSQYDVKFTGSGRSTAVATVDQNRISDYLPDKTNGFEVVENRVWTVLNDIGFDVDDSTFNLTLSLLGDVVSAPYNTTNVRKPKQGGSYGVGILFEDDYGKTSFVKGDKTITIPHDAIGNFNSRSRIRWTLTGTPPAGMTKYRIAISDNRFQGAYFQCKAIPHFYVSEIPQGFTDNTVEPNAYTLNGKLFKVMYNTADEGTVSQQLKVQNIYLQLPNNIPLVPDQSYLIKLPDGLPIKYIQVSGMIGEYLVIPFIEYSQWGTFLQNMAAGTNNFYIEVFKKATVDTSLYREIPKTYKITGGDFTVFQDDIVFGDAYNVQFGEGSNPGHLFTDLFHFVTNTDLSLPQYKMTKNPGVALIESPSGIVSGVIIETPNQVVLDQPFGEDTTLSGTIKKTVYSFDYNKISNDFGRSHTVYTDEKKRNLFSTVGFSNPYIQDSQINGTNTFLAANTYPLAIERGPISALVRTEKTLLAIHNQTTSSLYIGDGFVRTDKSFIMTKTDQVVGDDRNLEYGYGTINPESVIRVFGYVFFWDAYKGAVVQYTQAGLFNAAQNDMRSYFYKKGRDYFPYRNQVKIVTGFDHTTDELLINFPEVRNEANTVIIPAETWAFHLGDKEWSTRYDFYVEKYAAIGQQLFSFKDGKLWKHNDPTVPYNNFHGTQYTRKQRYASNPFLNKNKRYLNVHIKGSLCVAPASEFKPFKCYTTQIKPDGSALIQESYTPAYEFEVDEGIWVAPILKNINTPGDFTGRLALRSGDDMVGNWMEFEIENNTTDRGQTEYVNIVLKTEEFSA